MRTLSWGTAVLTTVVWGFAAYWIVNEREREFLLAKDYGVELSGLGILVFSIPSYVYPIVAVAICIASFAMFALSRSPQVAVAWHVAFIALALIFAVVHRAGVAPVREKLAKDFGITPEQLDRTLEPKYRRSGSRASAVRFAVPIRVGVKAKTGESVGPIERQEAMSAEAVVLVERPEE